jgi:hypothetical protein
MNHNQKVLKLREFPNEKEFRLFLIDLLKSLGFKNVQHTHSYGEPELGKDIIASINHPLDEQEWHAFVVKKGRVTGGTNEIENIKNQIKQAFEYPYSLSNGQSIKINKVKVVTNEHFTKGAIRAIEKSPALATFSNFDFWGNEKLIELIDEHYPDFWLPGDYLSKEYSKALSNAITNEFEIKELSVTKIPDRKIQKLLELFITPHLLEISPVKDSKLHKKVKSKKIGIEDIIKSKDNFIIEGDPGSGKSRLLNKLTCMFLDPKLMTDDKLYPVRLKVNRIKECRFDILESIKNEVASLISDDIDKFNFDDINFIVFIDSIDDLYSEEIKILIENIEKLLNLNRYRFIITARSLENISFGKSSRNVRELYLQNFNQKQIELFIKNYFEDANRGKRLLDVLRESNILEKLPTTPLTITLISLLYEDKDYEIPATITDIYRDFVDVLVGKLEVRSKIQLMDLEFKKRIFAYISYQMLKEKRFEMSRDEFVKRIQTFLTPKGVEFQDEEDLYRLISKSGLLYVDSHSNVGFKHLSFLEYFAALEIFYVTNSYSELINNFNDVNWQNTAIFYVGISKDMPWFIDELVQKVPDKDLRDRLLCVGGMGYLSQALYMTDLEHRSKLVNRALDDMIFAFRKLKELTKQFGYYYNMPLHVLGAMLMIWFNMNFRSITLIRCLENLYDDLLNHFEETGKAENFEIGFKLFLLATTLATQYLNRFEKLNDLIERDCFLKDPLLIVLGDMFLDIEEVDKKYISDEKRKKILKEIDRYRKILVNITKEPAYRFKEDYKRVTTKTQSLN